MQFKSVQAFLDHVQQELDANRLILPTLPDIALRVRDTVSRGDATAQELANMIVTDAALSTRLIQVSNSPLYRGAMEIKNIQMAVTRLGHKTIRTLITSLVMQQMFTPTTDTLEEYFRKAWEQSINVSSISRALVKRVLMPPAVPVSRASSGTPRRRCRSARTRQPPCRTRSCSAASRDRT